MPEKLTIDDSVTVMDCDEGDRCANVRVSDVSSELQAAVAAATPRQMTGARRRRASAAPPYPLEARDPSTNADTIRDPTSSTQPASGKQDTAMS
jgi:hypothetical protein